MGALQKLQQKNGLKTTQSVLNKQQSGQDAQQKANPQETAQQMNMNTAQAMLHNKENTLTPPKDAHEQAVRMNQQTADGMLHGRIPIVKKEEPKPQQEKKQLSYADMYRMLNPEESDEQKERREKRERTKARIAAIGDGLRALSNMYFATKGAKVAHNPEQDMSAVMLKRKQMMDAQREKNKAAWLNGYQRALALDEEARKNNATLAEQMRYHDILADKFERAGDQADKKIEQSGKRIQQSEEKQIETVRHNKETESIGHQNADSRSVSAAKSGKGKGGKSGKGKSSKEDYTKSLVELNNKDPNGVKAVTRGLKRSGVPKSAKTIVESYRKKNGSNNGKKKPTGVKW